MRVYDVSTVAEAMEQFRNLHEKLIVCRGVETFVETGALPTFDLSRCEELGIPVGKADYLGGSIVCFPGDLDLCLITWGNTTPDFGERCMEAVAGLLQNAGAEVVRDNNDVLADGKKVASWARATLITGWVQTVAHFSVNVDVDLIRRICTKPMEKVPGQLSDYGITSEMIWKEIEKGMV